MRWLVGLALVVSLAVNVGVAFLLLNGTPAKVQAASAGLTAFERSQLRVGCYQAAGTAVSTNNPNLGFIVDAIRDKCLSDIAKVP